MTKKDYQLFADACSLIEQKDQRDIIVDFLEQLFIKDNTNFDIDRFNDWINRRINKQSMKGTHYNPKYMPLGNN